jgi:hypothetical protein
MYRSNSIVSISPPDMFRNIKNASGSSVRGKLVEQFPFLTEVEINECRDSASDEFSKDDETCEKKLFVRVREYCMDQEILKTRFAIIGSILIILGLALIALVGRNASKKKAPEDDKIRAPTGVRHVVIGIIASVAFLALAAFFIFQRVRQQYVQSDVVKQIATFKNKRLELENVEKLRDAFGTEVPTDLIQTCGGLGFRNTRLANNGLTTVAGSYTETDINAATNGTIALPLACAFNDTAEPMNPPLAKCEGFRAGGTTKERVVTNTCVETEASDATTTTRIGTGRRTKNAYLWDGTRCDMSESDAASYCRALDTRTFEEAAADYKARERNVMWGFLAIAAAVVCANATASSWKKLK